MTKVEFLILKKSVETHLNDLKKLEEYIDNGFLEDDEILEIVYYIETGNEIKDRIRKKALEKIKCKD